MRMRYAAIGFGLLTVFVFWVGCGKPGTDPTVEVTGTVTYNGEPIEGVSVNFIPERGRPALGLTDASGKFSLSTFSRGDGAVAGLHKVGLTETPDGSPPMPGEPGFGKWKAPVLRFPKKYTDPEQSGFTASVELGKRNDFKYEMVQ